nr:basic proline-rich protein-like [Equus asinus]
MPTRGSSHSRLAAAAAAWRSPCSEAPPAPQRGAATGPTNRRPAPPQRRARRGSPRPPGRTASGGAPSLPFHKADPDADRPAKPAAGHTSSTGRLAPALLHRLLGEAASRAKRGPTRPKNHERKGSCAAARRVARSLPNDRVIQQSGPRPHPERHTDPAPTALPGGDGGWKCRVCAASCLPCGDRAARKRPSREGQRGGEEKGGARRAAALSRPAPGVGDGGGGGGGAGRVRWPCSPSAGARVPSVARPQRRPPGRRGRPRAPPAASAPSQPPAARPRPSSPHPAQVAVPISVACGAHHDFSPRGLARATHACLPGPTQPGLLLASPPQRPPCTGPAWHAGPTRQAGSGEQRAEALDPRRPHATSGPRPGPSPVCTREGASGAQTHDDTTARLLRGRPAGRQPLCQSAPAIQDRAPASPPTHPGAGPLRASRRPERRRQAQAPRAAPLAPPRTATRPAHPRGSPPPRGLGHGPVGRRRERRPPQIAAPRWHSSAGQAGRGSWLPPATPAGSRRPWAGHKARDGPRPPRSVAAPPRLGAQVPPRLRVSLLRTPLLPRPAPERPPGPRSLSSSCPVRRLARMEEMAPQGRDQCRAAGGERRWGGAWWRRPPVHGTKSTTRQHRHHDESSPPPPPPGRPEDTAKPAAATPAYLTRRHPCRPRGLAARSPCLSGPFPQAPHLLRARGAPLAHPGLLLTPPTARLTAVPSSWGHLALCPDPRGGPPTGTDASIPHRLPPPHAHAQHPGRARGGASRAHGAHPYAHRGRLGTGENGSVKVQRGARGSFLPLIGSALPSASAGTARPAPRRRPGARATAVRPPPPAAAAAAWRSPAPTPRPPAARRCHRRHQPTAAPRQRQRRAPDAAALVRRDGPPLGGALAAAPPSDRHSHADRPAKAPAGAPALHRPARPSPSPQAARRGSSCAHRERTHPPPVPAAVQLCSARRASRRVAGSPVRQPLGAGRSSGAAGSRGSLGSAGRAERPPPDGEGASGRGPRGQAGHGLAACAWLEGGAGRRSALGGWRAGRGRAKKGPRGQAAGRRAAPATKKGRLASPSGNRTPVSRVTGGDTHHYTNEDGGGRPGARPLSGCLPTPTPALEALPATGARHVCPIRPDSQTTASSSKAARGPHTTPDPARPALAAAAATAAGNAESAPPLASRAEIAPRGRGPLERASEAARRRGARAGPRPCPGRRPGWATGRRRRWSRASPLALLPPSAGARASRPWRAHKDARQAPRAAKGPAGRVGSQPGERPRAQARRQDGRAV